MKLNFRYKKNAHQVEFHNDTTTKFLHLSGGYGSGKSYALVMKIIQLSWINKDLPGGLICPSYADFKKDILPLMHDILTENRVRYDYHQTDHYFKFPWTKSALYVATGEKKLRGPNWAFAGINELTLLNLERFREVVGRVRLRKAKCSQIASVGTPEGFGNPYYEVFIEKPIKNSRVIYASTEANSENLDPNYIQSLKDSYDEISLKAYLNGMWINMNGAQFYYSYDPKTCDAPVEEIKYMPVHISMDFNVAPMAANIWQYDGKHLKCVDEINIPDNADTNKMCVALKARGYTPDRAIIYPDPAGQARSTKGQPDVEILKKHGFMDIKVRSKAPGMRQRQLNVCNLLSKGIIKINPSLAPELKKDLEAVEQDKATLEKVKDNPKRTHHSDGMDYLCDIMFPFKEHRNESRVLQLR